MTTVSITVGATTSSSARVVARITGTTSRLAVSTLADISQPVYFDPDATASDGAARFTATGLDPQTQYYYAIEDTGVLDTAVKGKFRTHAPIGQPGAHTVAYIGDAGLTPEVPGVGTVLPGTQFSNHPGFDSVRTYDPDLVVHVGDIHYCDLGSGNHGIVGGTSLANYRQAYTDVFAQPRQHQLYRDVPWTLMWDDHDFGPNNSDGTLVGKENGAQAYRERIPHYPTPAASGSPYQAWQVNRVQYVLLDTRYNRSPNIEPDGPGHSMLGSAQKNWLRGLLETSTSEVLVIISPTPWFGALGGDTWGGFITERTELVQMFTDTGWLTKMVMVVGDIHMIGIGDGSTNTAGGFPLMVTGSIDAGFGDADKPEFNRGYQPGRNQWTSIEVTDDGQQINLRMRTFVGPTEWISYTASFGADPAPVPPLPTAPPQFSEAAVRQEVIWLAVNRITGTIFKEIPEVKCSPKLQLSAYASTSLSIPLGSDRNSHIPIETLLAATDGRIGAIVAVVNDVPIWMGLPANRNRGSDGSINVPSANTPESYLLKRLARDVEFVNADRSRVALALAQQAESLNGLGQGLGFEYDVTDTGDSITIGYKTTDRMQIYKAVRALCAQGLEFTVNLDWGDASQTRVAKILKIARRIGVIDAPTMPILDTDVSVISYTHHESWADEDYANHITAIGPGQGEDQPASAPAIDHAGLALGYPLVESVTSPGNNIGDNVNLNEFATADLVRRKNGVESLDIKSSLYKGPLPCVHARIGDMIGHHLNGPGHPKPSIHDSADHALIGSARLTGMTIDPTAGTWTPGLVEDPSMEAA